MTIISTHKRYDKTEHFYKAVYAKARKESLGFGKAYDTFDPFLWRKCRCDYCIVQVPRQPMYSIRSWQHKENAAELYWCCDCESECDDDDFWDLMVQGFYGPGPTVSLFDIARPVSARKRSKKVIMKSAPHSVASIQHRCIVDEDSGDEDFEIWDDNVLDSAEWEDEDDDDEWERIEREAAPITRPSYASIVKGIYESG